MHAPSPAPTWPRLRIGVSSCLLGQQVRHDGQHKRDRYVTDVLGGYCDFVGLCPEVGIGLGVPRPPIRIVDRGAGPRVVGVADPTLDVTDRLRAYADVEAPRVAALDGYIFKRASPSCGVFRVKVYSGPGVPSMDGRGAFADAVMTRWPNLPVEEEGRLNDPVLRENFIERVFVYQRWRGLRAALTPRALVAFHSEHKLLIMAHNQAAYRRLGQRVAGAGRGDLGALADAYEAELMAALTRRATRAGHTNVLQHLMGYLKRALDAEDKRELLEVIEAYRAGQVPLVVPLTLLRHHFRRHPHPYVERQIYLQPHPAELMLRNHV